MKIILASVSPRRKELLSLLIDDFEIIPSNVDEEALSRLARTPEEMVVKLAQAKAKAVAENLREPAIVIGSDLTVVLEESGKWEAIGKPKTKEIACQMLTKLRNKSHKVITGVCVLNSQSKQMIIDLDVSTVRFKDFSEKSLKKYINEFNRLDCAAGYKIQDISDYILAEFKGSYTNILGLPLKKLVATLHIFAVPIKKDWQKRVKKEFGYE